MATTYRTPRSLGGLLRPGLTLALALGLGLTGLGCTSFGNSPTPTGGGIFSWASANPYEEPSGLSAWWNKKPATDGMVLPGGDAAERTAMDDKARRDLEIAKRQYLDKNYAEAEAAFNLIAKAKKLPV